MSESDDMGGFGEMTPSVPRTTAVAGPSRTTDSRRKGTNDPVVIDSDSDVLEVRTKKDKRKAGGVTVKRRRKEDGQGDSEDAREEVEDKRRRQRPEGEEVEEESPMEEVQVPAGKKRRAGSKPASRPGKAEQVNGASRAVKGKGKAKHDNIIEVDEVDSGDLDEDAIRAGIEGIANAITSAQRSGKQPASRVKPVSQMEGDRSPLREQLRQANAHVEELKQQLEELHKLKHTEPETLIRRMETQYRNERQAHDTLVRDLTEQLGRKQPLLRIGNNPFTQLLTREEADKELQGIKDQVNSYKAIIKERDEELAKKGEENGKLQTSVRELRHELQLEIERSKTLVNHGARKQPDSAFPTRRGRLFGLSEDPKMTALVKFYEDLTNLLIVDLKPQVPRHSSIEEWVITCLYSNPDMVDKSKPTKSFSFKLRQSFELKPGFKGAPKKADDCTESLQYTPLGLEGESHEFIESLRFLNTSFTFERDQLALFLRTLHDVVSAEGKEEEAQVSDDGIQFVG